LPAWRSAAFGAGSFQAVRPKSRHAALVAIEKVLMIDDEPDIRRIGEMSLSAIGKLKVLLASSGAEGLELARREKPDVILLDVMMPGLDGPATLQKLRADKETAKIPVIFMTAKVQRAEVERYLALGAQGVVPKPFDPLTLAASVRELVEKPR
jgi:CheY-like chemotaxis protein